MSFLRWAHVAVDRLWRRVQSEERRRVC